jgi:hypothetical protein
MVRCRCGTGWSPPRFNREEEEEENSFEDRYLVLQDRLDGSGGKFWGQDHGIDWETIKQAVNRPG